MGGRAKTRGVTWSSLDPAPRVAEEAAVIKSRPMNERQRAHIDFYLERFHYWRSMKDYPTARMLAARDADEMHALRSEDEAAEVADHLRKVEPGRAAGE